MWIAIIFIALVGTLSHFLYEISGHNKVVGLFAAVNESTWEHIKIALTPIFLFSLYDYFVYGNLDNYAFAKACSLVFIIIVIPILFYGYTSVTKKDFLPVDIVIFYLSIIGSQYIFYYILGLDGFPFIFKYLSIILIFLIFGFYMVATIFPFEGLIFKDPISKKYGIEGHTEFDHKKH